MGGFGEHECGLIPFTESYFLHVAEKIPSLQPYKGLYYRASETNWLFYPNEFYRPDAEDASRLFFNLETKRWCLSNGESISCQYEGLDEKNNPVVVERFGGPLGTEYSPVFFDERFRKFQWTANTNDNKGVDRGRCVNKQFRPMAKRVALLAMGEYPGEEVSPIKANAVACGNLCGEMDDCVGYVSNDNTGGTYNTSPWAPKQTSNQAPECYLIEEDQEPAVQDPQSRSSRPAARLPPWRQHSRGSSRPSLHLPLWRQCSRVPRPESALLRRGSPGPSGFPAALRRRGGSRTPVSDSRQEHLKCPPPVYVTCKRPTSPFCSLRNPLS